MADLILAADQTRVATCWIANFEPQRLREALGLGPRQEMFAIKPMGYPRADFHRKGLKQRRALEEIVR